jgi:hypothetical protein
VSDATQSDLTSLLQALVQQQTAMVQVQAESLRLQRLVIERLLGASNAQHVTAAASPIWTTTALAPTALPSSIAFSSATSEQSLSADTSRLSESKHDEIATVGPLVDVPANMPAADVQSSARGARYYQRPPVSIAKVVTSEELELLRRLQEMREASDLILQFGPYKGTTLAQVAVHHPDYVRQLVTGAQRPEVRAAAGRLVEALDAAADHKRRAPHGAGRRPTR